VQKTGGPILTTYMLHDMFLHKQLPFGGRDDCICVKIFSGVIVLITIKAGYTKTDGSSMGVAIIVPALIFKITINSLSR